MVYSRIFIFLIPVLLAIFASADVKSDCDCEPRPTKKQIEDAHEQAEEGSFICIYDGMSCKRAEDVCSRKSKTCHNAFGDVSEKDKNDQCNEELTRNRPTSLFEGRRDVCIYRRGLREVSQCQDCQDWKTEFIVVCFLLALAVIAIIILAIKLKKASKHLLSYQTVKQEDTSPPTNGQEDPAGQGPTVNAAADDAMGPVQREVQDSSPGELRRE